MGGGFRPDLVGIHRPFVALYHVVMKAVFHIPASLRIAIEPTGVCLVLCEQQWRLSLTPEASSAVVLVVQLDDAHALGGVSFTHSRPARVEPPGPGVPKPECREECQLSRIGPMVDDVNADQQILG